MGYTVYLMTSTYNTNSYGYWTGKNYTVQGELYPIIDDRVTERTKVYTSKKRAKNALESCLSRGYAYVLGGEIREL
jgi:hypothetical protein